jgi:hypothetical protein
MAGTGLDAFMIRDADGWLKDRVGRLAYVVTGARHLKDAQIRVKVFVDGVRWYKGKAGCVLFGNLPDILGGVTAFADARPDDGRLEIGVVTADGLVDWARTMSRTAVGQAERSPFVHTASGTSFDIKLERTAPWELDGGEREPTRRLKVEVEPAAITICVPVEGYGVRSRIAELCLGAIDDSLPPGCDGIPIEGWDWKSVDGEDARGGTTWGEFHVAGTYDGSIFVVASAGPADPATPDPSDIFATPCEEPADGWPELGPDADQARIDVMHAAEGEPTFAGFWMDSLGAPDEEGAAKPYVLNAAFTESNSVSSSPHREPRLRSRLPTATPWSSCPR